jgi:hypothetical protein
MLQLSVCLPAIRQEIHIEEMLPVQAGLILRQLPQISRRAQVVIRLVTVDQRQTQGVPHLQVAGVAEVLQARIHQVEAVDQVIQAGAFQPEVAQDHPVVFRQVVVAVDLLALRVQEHAPHQDPEAEDNNPV